MRHLNRFRLLVVLSLALLAGKSFAARFPPIERQEMRNWCWAAAVQNILGAAGIHQSQGEIVTRFTGGFVADVTADASGVAELIQSYGLPARQVGGTLKDSALEELFEAGNAAIAEMHPIMPWGRVNHAMVLQSLTPEGRVVGAEAYYPSTKTYTVRELRKRWRWSDTIVVELPSYQIQ
jgi:hypothetical protein